MTEQYWQRYKREVHDKDAWVANQILRDTKETLQKKERDKDPLALYNICKSENVYIRQVRASPNITLGSRLYI
jgi:hypothetical protein